MGGVLFEMAAGAQAFSAATVPSLLYRICHGEPDALGDYRDDAPPDFVRAIDHCLMREIDDRCTSADDLRREVRSSLLALAPNSFRDTVSRAADSPRSSPGAPSIGTTSTLSASAGAIESSAARVKRKKVLVPALVVLVVCVGGIGVYLATNSGSDAQSSKAPTSSASDTPPIRPAQPEAAGSPASNDAPDSAARPEAAAVSTSIIVESDPMGANVFDPKNRYMGITPLTLEPEAAQERLTLTLRMSGYLDETVELTTSESSTKTVKLSKKKRSNARTSVPAVTHPDPEVKEPTVRKLRGAYEEEL